MTASSSAAASLLRLPGLRSFRSQRFRAVCGLFLLAAAVWRTAIILPGTVQNMGDVGDFHVIVQQSGHFWYSGGPIYQVHPATRPDDVQTGARAEPYPPSFYLLIWPWVTLPAALSPISWIAVNLVALAIIVIAVYAAIGRPTIAEGSTAVALALLFTPVQQTIFEGQFGLVLAALVVLAMLAHERDRAGAGGVALGLAIALKGTPALLLPYFLWRRAFRLCAVTAATALAIFAVTLVLGWWGRWLAFQAMMGPIGRGTSFVANQSLGGVVLRLMNPVMIGQPIPPQPPAVQLVLLALQLLLLAFVVAMILRHPPATALERWSEFSLVLLAVPLWQPFAWFHHWAAALVAILVVGRLARLKGITALALGGMLAAYLVSLLAYPLHRVVRSADALYYLHHPVLHALSSLWLACVLLAILALGLGRRRITQGR